MTLTQFRTKLNDQLRDNNLVVGVSVIGLLFVMFAGSFFKIPRDSSDAILLELLVLFCGGYVTGNYFYNKRYACGIRWIGYLWGAALFCAYISNCYHLGSAISTMF